MRRPYTYAKIVQSAEQRTHIPYVGGSIPPLGTKGQLIVPLTTNGINPSMSLLMGDDRSRQRWAAR